MTYVSYIARRTQIYLDDDQDVRLSERSRQPNVRHYPMFAGLTPPYSP